MTNPRFGPRVDRDADRDPESPTAVRAALTETEVRRPAPRVTWMGRDGVRSMRVEVRALVGSSERAQVVLHDATVSRLHAELEARDDGLWIHDLGSRNGTWIEGVRVVHARIPDACVVRMGGSEIEVSNDDAAPARVELWPGDAFGPIRGRSRAMREIFARLARIAPTESTVLIHGETGTGKEVVARALHEASGRSDGPFVVVDCSALSESLLESELFGHARGSFTGAVSARAGAIESAQGGTVFLDEIGELPLSMQPKLLRVLESRTVRRLGESHHRSVDVRFVSATHRDLRALVNSGEFREDLYFRLAVIPLIVPPLRERREDIVPLAEHFLHAAGSDAALDTDVARRLEKNAWMGNVRELRNFVDRMVALGPGAAFAMASPATGGSAGMPSFELPFREFRDRWLEHGEREYIRHLLDRHDRVVAVAAMEAGVTPTYVYRLIRRHGL